MLIESTAQLMSLMELPEKFDQTSVLSGSLPGCSVSLSKGECHQNGVTDDDAEFVREIKKMNSKPLFFPPNFEKKSSSDFPPRINFFQRGAIL